MSKAKEYNSNNRSKKNQRHRDRYKNQPQFKLRELVSRSIKQYLHLVKYSKNGSVLQYLEYDMKTLYDNIESKFEFWMTWENHGKYDPKSWNDDDPTTWKWQLDHITPHSTFKYTSMSDNDFKKCWSLENLRPYSAKQNILDGTARKRHKGI